MINPIDLRKGMVIKVDGELYTVTFSQFVNPGKGSAFVRTKIKHIKKGNIVERTFKSSEKIEDVELDKRTMTYLYREGDNLVMMDQNDYEQFNIPVSLLEDILQFIKEQMTFDIYFYENQPVSVSPPTFVELEVTYAEEGVKGDTVGTAWKKVQVETGGEILVPIHIRQGDIIKIDLRDLSFVERVNK
ncbi:MAG: elongation factor P [Leptospiraceae bacterium]|nr:elongation factor P [Leptospiraceae bacterium]MDW7975019.1 elongation factor P [Leptospiraceae bacterium]